MDWCFGCLQACLTAKAERVPTPAKRPIGETEVNPTRNRPILFGN